MLDQEQYRHGVFAAHVEQRRDSGSANKNKLKEGWKSLCLSHFCGIRLSEKRGGAAFSFRKNVKVGLA
jgi:hypothetical protein